MLPVKLAKAAAQAEKLHVEAMARRQAKRCLLAAIGGAFIVAALSMAHVVLEIAFGPKIGALSISGILLVFDLVMAIAFCAMAARSRPGKIEFEAAQLRTRALRQMKEELSFFALVPALLGAKQTRDWLFTGLLLSRFLRRKSPQ